MSTLIPADSFVCVGWHNPRMKGDDSVILDPAWRPYNCQVGWQRIYTWRNESDGRPKPNPERCLDRNKNRCCMFQSSEDY